MLKYKTFLLRKEYYIVYLLIFAFFLRNYVLASEGIHLSINSDDAGYIRSAIDLLNSGTFSYHKAGSPTVHIMPGQTIFIATIFFIFGSGDLGIYMLKTSLILMGLASIFGVYLIGKYIHSIWTGLIAALFLTISVPHILMENLVLTETPFMFCVIYFLYFTIRHANEKNLKYFYLLLIIFIIGLFIRPTIGLLPLILVPYYLLMKYPIKDMIKLSSIAAFIIVLVLMPWWIRNYNHFDTFIPLTASSGDPLLLGTFQGVGYPNDETYKDIIAEVRGTVPISDAYYVLMYTKVFAEQRMQLWWETDPKSMIRSYLWEKPKIMWKNYYYKIPIFGMTHEILTPIQRSFLVLTILGTIVTLILSKTGKRELILVLGTLFYFTALNAYYYANPRYLLPLQPLIYLCSALFITVTCFTVKSYINKLSKYGR